MLSISRTTASTYRTEGLDVSDDAELIEVGRLRAIIEQAQRAYHSSGEPSGEQVAWRMWEVLEQVHATSDASSFDRWLTARDAEKWDEGYRAGEGYTEEYVGTFYNTEAENPYAGEGDPH